MTTRLTLFSATLVQDPALSVSGLDRESSADQPFALVEDIVDGRPTLVPTLVGRGLKGAAVAMARRFFDLLSRAVSDNIKFGALRRSVWKFADATASEVPHIRADINLVEVLHDSTDATASEVPRLRAGAGIRHKTGARASGVLYDREVIP